MSRDFIKKNLNQIKTKSLPHRHEIPPPNNICPQRKIRIQAQKKKIQEKFFLGSCGINNHLR